MGLVCRLSYGSVAFDRVDSVMGRLMILTDLTQLEQVLGAGTG